MQKKLRLQRLEDELKVFKTRLGVAEDRLDDKEVLAVRALAEAKDYHRKSLAAAKAGQLQLGWKKLHCAKEAVVGALDGHRLRLEADDLLRTAAALDEDIHRQTKAWLKDSIKGRSLDERRETVRLARRIQNDYWDRGYHNSLIVASRMMVLFGILMAATALAVWLVHRGTFELVPGIPGGIFAVVIVALGIVGGGLSALVATATGSTGRILPQTHIEGAWNLLRAGFGGTSAFLVVLALGAGILGVDVLSRQGYYVWAVVAGFSEGLFLRIAVGLASRISNDKAKVGPADA